MPYTPDNLTIYPWSSPVTISGTDLIRNLDEAVNTIISTDANSIKNHVNTQLDKIPPYLSSEFNKIYTGVETNATIATTKAAEASASATSASNSATTATNQATIATTKASEASASETSASNSATTATTKASEASASATSASNSATSASNSATTATTKANEASASATAAYNAQLAAEAVFDNFDDKYLGAKVIAPTVHNDGNPLVTGALFFKTTAPKGIYVYDAELSAWSIFSYIPTSHGTLSGRSDADSHPMSSITGLVEALADKLSKTLDVSIDGIKTFLKSPIAPTPTAGDNSQKVATTAFVQGEKVKGLLAEYVVTGSPITSIDFSNLDINTHKSYRVEISIANATANSSGLYCFINGDTNLTNYYRELVQFDGTTIGANRANNPQIITLQPSSSLSLTSNVQRGDKGYARAINFGNSSNGSSILKEDSTLVKTATVSNITQLTFTTSVVNAIAIGSKIRIYRGDV